jgi:hypothetical protein
MVKGHLPMPDISPNPGNLGNIPQHIIIILAKCFQSGSANGLGGDALLQ